MVCRDSIANAAVGWRRIETPNGTVADADLFPGRRVLVSGPDCGHAKSHSPGRTLMRLCELRPGGARASLREVAGHVPRKRRCGARDWRADPAFPPGLSDGEIKPLAARARN